ncbi:hypothetical protein LTR66_012043 [Elasticomyces elasticus]|nr:hypothetical protein LTR28_013765 [Elasticomyces elasticus]KAK4966085.1 hypothetical protein LTR66_012043 [Elasticomyces elasticus]KAK4993702.1 hypothetical protein LTR50_000313 [Elasticomyces elasticus]
MPKEPKGVSEVDILLARTNVALARSQRLIQSWLPPPAPDELADTKTEQDRLAEEEELFKPTPDLLGVGAKAPDDIPDGSFQRKSLSSNDKLLEQLIGKKAAKDKIAARQKVAAQHTAAKPRVPESEQKPTAVESEDEEEGRTAVFRSKRSKKRKIERRTAEDALTTSATSIVEVAANGFGEELRRKDDQGAILDASLPDEVQKVRQSRKAALDSGDERPAKRRPGSFLDEIMAEKARKKKKKKHRKAANDV